MLRDSSSNWRVRTEGNPSVNSGRERDRDMRETQFRNGSLFLHSSSLATKNYERVQFLKSPKVYTESTNLKIK